MCAEWRAKYMATLSTARIVNHDQIDDCTPENGPLRYIPGSHKTHRLMGHTQDDSPDYTLNQKLNADEYDESQAEDLIIEAGQMALHDVYIAHGSAGNQSPQPRRGMTMRMMPTTSVYDRELAAEMNRQRGGATMADHSIFLMRGGDASGQNDFRLRAQAWAN